MDEFTLERLSKTVSKWLEPGEKVYRIEKTGWFKKRFLVVTSRRVIVAVDGLYSRHGSTRSIPYELISSARWEGGLFSARVVLKLRDGLEVTVPVPVDRAHRIVKPIQKRLGG